LALGEKIMEGQGKSTGGRVLPSDGPAPKMEASYQGSAKILGVEATEMGTWISVTRPTGVMFAEGQGVITTKDGEVVTYSGQGIGIPKGDGAVNWRGAIYCQTASEKLASLNNVAIVYEWDSDANGNYQANGWEWK